MNTQNFILFVACLLFGFFNLYGNLKTGSKLFKWFTFFMLWLSILGAGFLLVVSFLY